MSTAMQAEFDPGVLGTARARRQIVERMIGVQRV